MRMPQRLAARLGELDIRERFAPRAPAWAVQFAFAAFCVSCEIVVRVLINQFFPGAAPFALIFPATLAATLFAGWQCGFLTLTISEVLAWYFVIPVVGSFAFPNPEDSSRLIVIFLAGIIVVFLANAFRTAARNAASVRTAQVEERDLLLREIEHRIKNNFAMVNSLVEMQRRNADSDEVKRALSAVAARVESFARAHNHLYRSADDVGAVEMRAYVRELGEALAQALAQQGAIELSSDADDLTIDRDRAVTIGLLINELVTNAAKHAFRGRDRGAVDVQFRRNEDGWRLIVADDGVGFDPATVSKIGLGQRLVEAFVRQANGTLTTESNNTGTRVVVDFEA
ncbi:MAG: histidine kinase dimerization/phosphoacceptor domain -containing protein [Hyphomonadaceae bacterium]